MDAARCLGSPGDTRGTSGTISGGSRVGFSGIFLAFGGVPLSLLPGQGPQPSPSPPGRSSGLGLRRHGQDLPVPAPLPSLHLCSRPLSETATNERQARLLCSQWNKETELSIKAPAHGQREVNRRADRGVNHRAGGEKRQPMRVHSWLSIKALAGRVNSPRVGA